MKILDTPLDICVKNGYIPKIVIRYGIILAGKIISSCSDECILNHSSNNSNSSSTIRHQISALLP